MARLARLALPGQTHLVTQHAHGGCQLFVDDDDRRQFLACLKAAVQRSGVHLHAYAIEERRFWLLATPPTSVALGRAMQALGRGYTAAHRRHHGGSGTLWEGRYRCTVVEPGPQRRDALLFVEQSPVRAGLAVAAGQWRWSSARHHLGVVQEGGLTDVAEYWNLGNTPFDRAVAYAQGLDELLPEASEREIANATLKGWVLGSSEFIAALQTSLDRPLAPRRRGRPPGHR